ncbi:MAG: YfhO family protein [Acutalibacteraceae bacterium]|nr:YfhO family protein [Acutalibacteraceae bacterium]
MDNAQQINTSATLNTLQKKSFKEKLFEQKFIALAFLLPFLIMGIAFAAFKVYPFGDQQILVTDFWQQYYPFFCNFQSKLQEGSSMLWSWGTGLGTNYIALISYYLASPLNLLLFFAPAEYLREFLTVFLMIKIGCAGMFMAIFLRNVFKRNDFSIVFFSLLFALCAFTMGYYWNIIWFDAFALLPLVVSGTYSLIVKGKYKTYVIALALTMITNYYIGFFTCIFTVIVFIAIMVIGKPSWKVFFRKLLCIAGFSVLALSIGVLFMLPALFALQNTHSIDNAIPAITEIYEYKYNDNIIQYISDILGNTVTYTKPTDKEGLPNIYCGFICVLLSAFYFRCKKITFREKVVSIAVLVLFICCCIFKLPNFIIHGFHLPNMLPYRFSFLISFVLVVMAYRAFLLIDKVDIADIFIMAITGAVFIVFAYVGPQTVDSTTNQTNTTAVMATIAATIVYLAILLLRNINVIPKQAVSIGMFVVILAEMISGAFLGVKTVRVTSHDGYPDQNEAIQTLKNNIENNDDDLFYRMEMQQNYTINDSTIYGYNGVSLFSSTVNESITNFVNGMGMIGWDAGNRYYYCETSPLTSSFLNIKYMLARRSVAGNTNNWEFIETIDGASSYKNTTSLSLGFMTDDDIKTFDYNFDKDDQPVESPFDAQNSLFTKSTGINEDIFTNVKGDPLSTGFPVSINSNTSYYCDATSEAGTLTLTYTATKDNTPLYAYTSCENCENNTITITGESGVPKTYEIRFPYIISLGVYDKGESVKIAIPYSVGTSGTSNVWVCEFNESVYQKGYEKLNDEMYEITEFETSTISGTITAKEDGVMYTSIPYEEGWTAYVDGKEVEITPLANNALVSIDLTKGEHTVTFKYMPKGFAMSFTLFVVGILVFVVLIIFEHFYLKKKKNRSLLLPMNSAIDELVLYPNNEENLENNKKSTKK